MNSFTEILFPTGRCARQSGWATARSHAGAPAFDRLIHLLISEDEGASLVEFALVSSMLLLPLTTFIMSFGAFMANQMQLINATDIGARAVAVNGGITLDPCNIASSAVIAAAPGLNPSQLTFNYSFNGTPFSGTSCASATLVTPGSAAANLAGGTTATITVSYPCNLSIFGRNFMPTGCSMRASTSEMVQ
jgi:Flp pilus assembly protein TadG